MPTNKNTKKVYGQIELCAEQNKVISYATYYCRRPLFASLKILNNGKSEISDAEVRVEGSNELILPATIKVGKILAESCAQVNAFHLINPKYLADLEAEENCIVAITLLSKKTQICAVEREVTAIPMDSFRLFDGNEDLLAALVRPKLPDLKKLLEDASRQLKSWGYPEVISGYSGADKNALNRTFASLFSAIRSLNIKREACENFKGTVSVGSLAGIVPSRSATPMGMSVFAASCLEAAGLNPIIAVGANKLGVGVWLKQTCFNSPVQDDTGTIERYISSGVNNLAIVDVEDLFAHKNAGYTTSSAHFASALSGGGVEYCIDVKRCRIGGVFPMPVKISDGTSYEILGDEAYSYDNKPEILEGAPGLSLNGNSTKSGGWERRLLDLSLKNNLLNFRYRRDCVRILSCDIKSFSQDAVGKSLLSLRPSASPVDDGQNFGVSANVKALSELISLELQEGIVRSYCGEEQLCEAVNALIRKGRISQEEVGANTIYLALGFLRWRRPEESGFKYAPIALLPVTVKRSKAQGAVIEPGEDYLVNTTLLEFLNAEFGLDLRGMPHENLTPAQMLAAVRLKTADMNGWLVYDDIYLAQFTFAGYAVWRDVHDNVDIYKQNKLISALLEGDKKCVIDGLCGVSEDDAEPTKTLTPLECDSFQFSAIAEAQKGTTFVLHGAPGTGKSQTITNIVANALHDGKTVLFVAEKRAALEVVKKRLNDIGIGEFCLELHSGKTADKPEIINSIKNTLALNGGYDGGKFHANAEAIRTCRKTLSQPFCALHKKRSLGISVYEGISGYLANSSAPDLFNTDGTFYEGLTEQKLCELEGMITAAQAAAKQCGNVHASPFSNVNICEYSEGVKQSLLTSAKVLSAELTHLKNYVALFSKTFGQRVGAFTSQKLARLLDVVKILDEGSLKNFFACDEAQLHAFYNASVKYDALTKEWYTRFKGLADLSKFGNKIGEEIAGCKGDYRASRTLIVIYKRLSKLAKTPIKEEEVIGCIKCAHEIDTQRLALLSNTNLSSNFVGLAGGINDRRREQFMKPLYSLHAICKDVFEDYNAGAFNSVCVSAADGRLKPLYAGVISAARAFYQSRDYFNFILKTDDSALSNGDIFACYASKCSALIKNIDALPAWTTYKSIAKKLNQSGLTFITAALESGRINSQKILAAFRKNVYANFVRKNIDADPRLCFFSSTATDEAAIAYSRLMGEHCLLSRERIRAKLISRLPKDGTEGELASQYLVFRRKTGGSLRSINLRTLFSEVPQLLKVAAPCMLMSPFTVSQYLPAQANLFDLVIFDEASQLPTCEAVPSLGRAKSAVIVGDPKQMPPTSFFMSAPSDEQYGEAEDLKSVLDDCLALGIPEKHLIWHYRSEHESLIAFSNAMYYSGRLCTVPSPNLLSDRVKLCYIERGIYRRGQNKCNTQEAEALVSEVIKRLSSPTLRRSSIGVVTFSAPQQLYIEKLLSKRIAKAGLEEAAYERDEPLFVKNLENVQGDERDVILFSVCYGPGEDGRISLNFGALNKVGGWRRLNVAVSRARKEMIVYSSMRHHMIDLSRTTSRGVAGLKRFLEFAENGKVCLPALSTANIPNAAGIGGYIAERLKAYGYDCLCNVGASSFKIDVAVLNPKNKKSFILAILCDVNKSFSVKDNFVVQTAALNKSGWNVFRLYSVSFFNNPVREIKKIKALLDKLTRSPIAAAEKPRMAYKEARREATKISSRRPRTNAGTAALCGKLAQRKGKGANAQ